MLCVLFLYCVFFVLCVSYFDAGIVLLYCGCCLLWLVSCWILVLCLFSIVLLSMCCNGCVDFCLVFGGGCVFFVLRVCWCVVFVVMCVCLYCVICLCCVLLYCVV